MKLVFFHSDKSREKALAEAVIEGAWKHGLDAVARATTGDVEDADIACMVGVKSLSLWRKARAAGAQTIMLDKGYKRSRKPGSKTWEYWRVAVNAHNATKFIANAEMPSDRAESLGLELKPWRDEGAHVVFAGSSVKYHQFHGLPHPTDYARAVTEKIIRKTVRKVVYRPKPSWRGATPVEGTEFSSGNEGIMDALKGAHALVTHGSNACFEAVLSGIPCVILGDGIAKPISSWKTGQTKIPLLADDAARKQWLANVAYCQWTEEEFAAGEAWEILKQQIA